MEVKGVLKVDRGALVISLDFELYWGMRDIIELESFKNILLGARAAIPKILKLFDMYDIHATWATVGLLFFETKEDMMKGLPKYKPLYKKKRLSPYNNFGYIGSNEFEDPFHYGSSLINLILKYPNQEVGTHTFSHYYCLEDGQDINSFRHDLLSAINIAKKYNTILKSLVFPKNQYNSNYLSVCKDLGITSYRGNPKCWFYAAKNSENEPTLNRILRLIDTYFNISGHNSYCYGDIKNNFPHNIPYSRFLRPYSKRFKHFEKLKIRRIKDDLTFAAKNKLLYHLWWHPYNFGTYQDENLLMLEKILKHYSYLRDYYGMCSYNMAEIAKL